MIGLTLTGLLLIASCAQSANILLIIPFSAMSHYIAQRPIGLELARRGHNVTVITSHLEKDTPPNYHQVKVVDTVVWDLFDGGRPNVFTMVDLSAEEFHHILFWGGGLDFTEVVLNSTEVREFLQKDNAFDLVISEQFFQEALYTLAYKYNAPLALVTTFGNCMRHNIAVRNPLQLATLVSEFLNVNNPTGLRGRLRNFYFTIYEYVYWRFVYLRKQEALVQKYIPGLPAERPSLYQLQQNCSLMLLNSHFSFDPPVAYLPNIIEIGGVHLSHSNTTLSQKIQKFLDESTHGVVYMNFGSNIRSTELSAEKKKAIVNVFRRLKQNVIWKWEDEKLEEQPKNLLVQKWLPQKEILAHRNVKLFVSHGGLIGTQEAIFYGVPIIGVPIYADQFNNMLLVEQIGFGKLLQYHDINEESFEKALNEVISDVRYTNVAKEVSRKFKDRPMTPLDTAMFWLEYVIRNNGAEHMKNPARDITWTAYAMLDVYAFVLLLFIAALMITVKTISVIRTLLSSYRKQCTDIKKKT